MALVINYVADLSITRPTTKTTTTTTTSAARVNSGTNNGTRHKRDTQTQATRKSRYLKNVQNEATQATATAVNTHELEAQAKHMLSQANGQNGENGHNASPAEVTSTNTQDQTNKNAPSKRNVAVLSGGCNPSWFCPAIKDTLRRTTLVIKHVPHRLIQSGLRTFPLMLSGNGAGSVNAQTTQWNFSGNNDVNLYVSFLLDGSKPGAAVVGKDGLHVVDGEVKEIDHHDLVHYMKKHWKEYAGTSASLSYKDLNAELIDQVTFASSYLLGENIHQEQARHKKGTDADAHKYASDEGTVDQPRKVRAYFYHVGGRMGIRPGYPGFGYYGNPYGMVGPYYGMPYGRRDAGEKNDSV